MQQQTQIIENRFEETEAERLARPALRVQGLTKSFFHIGEGKFSVQDVTVTLERG